MSALVRTMPINNGAWLDHRVVTFNGQHDTRLKTGEDYSTLTLAELFDMGPASRDKRSSPACIPSSYHNYDAREHARQREAGQFVALCGDVDAGDHALERLTNTVQTFAAGAAWLVYSSAHAREGDMRWRIIIPLDQSVPFPDWHDAQCALFAFMEKAGIVMDHAMARAAQPVYLPNVPAVHTKSGTPLRAANGAPLFYQSASTKTALPGLAITTGTVATGIEAIRQQRAADDRERDQIRRAAASRRANRPAGDSGNIIDAFNATNSVAVMLELCGYEQSPRHAEDWRSPHQTGGTYATRIIGEKWVSLSGSDAACGVGELCKSGCFGDAYDLLVHYKHGGDHKAAFRQIHAERTGSGTNVIRARFTSEPPPSEHGDPGWQEVPEWVQQSGSGSDYEAGLGAESAAASVEDRRSIRNTDYAADKVATAGPARVIATPYVWRDPTTLKPREWVYGRSIQRGHVRAILAPGAAGKTILSVGEALAMATGRNLLGQEVPGGPKRVWLWNLEDDGEELARIIQAACKHWSIGPEHIRDRLFVDSALEGAILKLATSTAAEGLVINRPLVAGLTGELIERGIDYLHVDPFVSSHAANENDNMEIDTIAKEWALVSKNAKCGVGLAHHVSKAGAAEVTALSGRGAVALINACRSVLVLNRMGEDEAKRYGIEDEKRRRYFRTYDDKNNRAPPSDASDWFQMVSISLGNGVNDDGDNMGVVIPWSPPDAFEGITVEHLRRVQAAIGAGEYKAHHSATDWAGNAVADVLGLSVADKGDKARISRMLAAWVENDVLRVEERKDGNRQMKKFVVVGRAADDLSATPARGVASQGVAAEPSAATLHPSPYKGGSVAVADSGGGKTVRSIAGNPALGGAPRDMPRTVF